MELETYNRCKYKKICVDLNMLHAVVSKYPGDLEYILFGKKGQNLSRRQSEANPSTHLSIMCAGQAGSSVSSTPSKTGCVNTMAAGKYTMRS